MFEVTSLIVISCYELMIDHMCIKYIIFLNYEYQSTVRKIIFIFNTYLKLIVLY